MPNVDKLTAFEEYTAELPGPPKRAQLTPQFVWIVEWINPGDRKTGLELHEWLQSKREGWSRYVPCTSRGDVLSALNRVTRLSIELHKTPLLHFETHGSEDGIGATNSAGVSEGIYWQELSEVLQDLNVATRCNLIWFVVACKGIAAIKALTKGPRAPVAILAGPDRDIPEGQAILAAKEFYRSLISGEEDFTNLIDNATREMCEAVIEPEPFAVLAFESMVQHILAELRHGNRPDEGLLQAKWDTMFMMDLFPENRDRFGVDVRRLLRAMEQEPKTKTVWVE